jgi:hypothetical protein
MLTLTPPPSLSPSSCATTNEPPNRLFLQRWSRSRIHHRRPFLTELLLSSYSIRPFSRPRLCPGQQQKKNCRSYRGAVETDTAPSVRSKCEAVCTLFRPPILPWVGTLGGKAQTMTQSRSSYATFSPLYRHRHPRASTRVMQNTACTVVPAKLVLFHFTLLLTF